MGNPQAIGHLRVINVQAGAAWIIPAERPFLLTLHEQIEQLLVDNGMTLLGRTDKREDN